LDENGEFIEGKIHSFRQEKATGVHADPLNSAALKIKDLTTADFPELRDRLVIDDEGNVFTLFAHKLKTLGLQNPASSIPVPDMIAD
jgi:hypothetical protein